MKKTEQLEIIDPPKNGIQKQETNSDKFIEMAIQSNAPVETLERLFALKKELDAIEARKKFFAALSGFQSEMGTVIKDKAVSFGTGKAAYNYATLDAIIEQARPLLFKYDLSYQFKIKDEGERLYVTCVLTHKDGHSEETTMSGMPDGSGNKNPIQQRASAITYMERYTFTGSLGITTGNDTDGTPLNTEENWKEKIQGFKDYDSLRDYGNSHSLRMNPEFRSAMNKRIQEIKGGN